MKAHPILPAWLLSCAAFVSAADAIDFNRDIRPILSNNCFKCHGPDESLREAGLRLDDRDGAIQALDSGTTAIVPGKPEESELIARINSEDADLLMPPPSSNKHLTAAQKQLLRDWISAGAEYKQHWSFVKPVRPAVPEIQDSKSPVRNPIDAFIGNRLQREGLSMSAEADRYTLIRRVSLDLIGLPPTPEEADAFVRDASSDAYEKLVDRLLASPHYGERWARRWLDLARYADTNGYEKDRPRSMWPYRDWVVRALNDDMPFDQFTIRQIAGDMLPNATIDDIVATGFHRNTMLNEEGGIDPQEFRFYSNVDRVGTTGAVWLGLTMACAQCHTHKYDPIVHKEFYQLMSFFDQADEPMFDVPSPELTARRAEIEKQVAAAEADLPNRFPLGDPLIFSPLSPTTADSANGALLTVQDGQTVFVSGTNPDADTYTLSADFPTNRLAAIRLEALADSVLPSKGPGRTPHGNFVLSGIHVTAMSRDGSGKPIELKFSRAEADFSQNGYPVEGALDADPRTGWAVQDHTRADWNANRTATFHLEQPVESSTGWKLTIKLEQHFGGQHTIGKFRISAATPNLIEGSPEEQRANLREKKFQAWLEDQSARAVRWTGLKPTKMSSNLPTLDRLDDNSILASGDQTKLDVYEVSYDSTAAPKISAIRIEALPDPSLPAGGPGRVFYEGPRGDFVLSELKITANGQPVKLASALQTRGSAGNAIDGKTETAWSIDGGQGQRQVAVFKLSEPLLNASQLDVRMEFEKYYAAALGRFRISVADDQREVSVVDLPPEVESQLLDFPASRDRPEFALVRKHWLSVAPELAAERGRIDALRKQMPAYPTSLVMRQRRGDRYRQTTRYHRGEFLQPKEPVQPGGLAALHAMPQDARRDRLTFARWLVDRNNPLVARVTMNRHWAAFFGRGIVRTTEDFGTQGELPTDPELLDWLATEFMDRGWSQKAMHRLIVSSAVYRQSSRMTPEHVAKDPVNKLYARGPRVRLEAELIRDSMLAASGLLSRKMGGPSVFPPQLPSITTEGAFGAFNWKVSTGEDRYRRSLYTFSKRTAPFAMFTTFDAPSGEACVPRRDTSNTPLQSLTLLNDAMLFEAAQALGKMYASGGTDEERSASLFRRCLVRPPQPEEVNALVQFVRQQRERFPNDEPFVWTALARSVLNLDEMIVKQ